MIVMPANWSAGLVHYWAGRCPGLLGHLYSPGGFRGPFDWLPYSLDNGAFAGFNESRWRRLLWQASCATRRPLWAAVPDAVCDAEKTLALWGQYHEVVVAHGFLPAFVVQDGHTASDVPSDAAVVFVGGSTKWKQQTVSYWCDRFERVHVGRVNQYWFLRHCADAGAESCDGTGYGRRGTGRGRRNCSPSDELVKYLEEEEAKMATMTLEVTREFDAAHCLRGTFPDDHPCSRLHGHRYRVSISVTGDDDNEAILVDYHDLYRALDDAVAMLDHRPLEEVLEMPTTCENLCRWFRKELRKSASCANLSRVVVSEQAGTRCVLSV